MFGYDIMYKGIRAQIMRYDSAENIAICIDSDPQQLNYAYEVWLKAMRCKTGEYAVAIPFGLIECHYTITFVIKNFVVHRDQFI